LEVRREGALDAMLLRCEAADYPESLAQGVAESLQNITKLKGEVALVAPGSLPNDGKVIDDQRRYDA
ncbi:MAG TPA: phenylacetate--CoA ligase family protein, partial [Kiloniellales bacterium]|nr:phenylacetate--CoA ligase family protein [Kiloniellales bacterium]